MTKKKSIQSNGHQQVNLSDAFTGKTRKRSVNRELKASAEQRRAENRNQSLIC